MINFRFHLISLTAVFLAFAIGLVLGTNFLADASENYLERQLDNLEHRLNDERATIDDLTAQLNSLESEDEQLDEQLGERLFTGQLTSDPVLVMAPRGLQGDPGPVDRVLESLGQADADVAGVWWFTDRLVLDDDDEVAELGTILGVTDTDPVALRAALATRLAEVLSAATDAGGDTPGPGLAAAQSEPDLLIQLREAGFVEYEKPDDEEGDVVVLPSSGLRVVAVTGQGAVLTGDQLLLPIVAGMAAEAPVPVVVAETPILADDQSGEDTVDPLVGQIRADGDLRERISTVDDLDGVSGRVATVLALDDANPSAPIVGHYGLRPDADRLLPAPPE